MVSINNFNELSFLIYGLGITGKSVINFFKKNNFENYQVWDDKNKTLYKSKRPKNLDKVLQDVNYIILSPGISLRKLKNKNNFNKYQNKIITDLDLIFLLKDFFKSIVVTGTNGKSTTCKITAHLLKKNNYKILLGGNIGTPLLNFNVMKSNFLIIEASSFQLAYSKFINPDYSILLNITNDHLDWHGNMKNYINSKLKIFENQKKIKYHLLIINLSHIFEKKNFKAN